MNRNLTRFTAQRFGTNEWLHFNLPLEAEGPPHTSTSYETLTGTIAPEVANSVAEDGRRLLEPWGTWVHVETADAREWTGIVTDISGDGATLRVEIREWIGYLHGLTFLGLVWGVKADPADLVRELIEHVQSFPTGNLGIQVVGSTPVRVGSESEDKAIAARKVRNTAKAAHEAIANPRKAKQEEIKKKGAPFDKQIKQLTKEKKPLNDAYQVVVRRQKPVRDAYTNLTKERTRRRAVYDALVAQKASAADIANALAKVAAMDGPIKAAKVECDELNPARDAAKAPVDAKNAQIATKRAERDVAVGPLEDELEALKDAEAPLKEALDAAEEVVKKAEEKLKADGGAYKILGSDRPDCWKALTDLAKSTPFGFVARTERSHGAPKLILEIKYPGVGRTRSDLVFETGRNILGEPKVQVPEEYASEIIAVGAGEGESVEGFDLNLQTMIAEVDPRMRRNAVYSDPSITQKAVLAAVGRAELARMRVPLHVPEIVVKDDPNCPIGAWEAGDIITIKLHQVPHFGRVVVKHRITHWNRIDTHKARIFLEAA